MNQRVTPAELQALLKPKGRPHINRASREDRTYRGVVYDSAYELRYAQACDLQGIKYERQKGFDLVTWHGEIVGTYRIDFWHPDTQVGVEIKGDKRDKNGNIHGHWSQASLSRWRLFRACWPEIKVQVLAWHKGNFREVTPKLKKGR
jgi:very-short-patch-repair endonuclease